RAQPSAWRPSPNSSSDPDPSSDLRHPRCRLFSLAVRNKALPSPSSPATYLGFLPPRSACPHALPSRSF
uniref:Uncharacterized protein n=1 Tax=Aegilops tauschii subsp. strangulata TaxID=200361 RepID=A0A453RYS9_AEGTS